MSWDPTSNNRVLCERCRQFYSLGAYPTREDAISAVATTDCPHCGSDSTDVEDLGAVSRDEAQKVADEIKARDEGVVH